MGLLGGHTYLIGIADGELRFYVSIENSSSLTLSGDHLSFF